MKVSSKYTNNMYLKLIFTDLNQFVHTMVWIMCYSAIKLLHINKSESFENTVTHLNHVQLLILRTAGTNS